MSNINLDGGETSLIRALGFGGAPLGGRELKTRLTGIGDSELFEILKTLIALGYVSSSQDIAQAADLDRTSFFINPGYAKELKEALNPRPPEPTRRVRRQ